MLSKFNVCVNGTIVFGAFSSDVCIRYIAQHYWDDVYTEKDKKDYGLISYTKDKIYIMDQDLIILEELIEPTRLAVEKRKEEANEFTKRINKYGVDFLGTHKFEEEEDEKEEFEEEEFEEDFKNEEELENKIQILRDKINTRFIDMNDVEENNNYENYFTKDINYTEDYQLN